MTTAADYLRKTDDEIAALAKRVYRNEVFVSWMMGAPSDLPLVFMVLNFLDQASAKQMVDNDIRFFYEAYDQAGPGSINGYPIFFSAHYLSGEDGHRLYDKVQAIRQLVG